MDIKYTVPENYNSIAYKKYKYADCGRNLTTGYILLP